VNPHTLGKIYAVGAAATLFLAVLFFFQSARVTDQVRLLLIDPKTGEERPGAWLRLTLGILFFALAWPVSLPFLVAVAAGPPPPDGFQ
jgi:hypothetical protein